MLTPRLTSLFASAFGLSLTAGTAGAAPTVVNLTLNGIPPGAPMYPSTDQGTIGGTIFKIDNTQPAGTGVFNPFLRLDVKGNGGDEQGYNTNGVKGDASNNYTTRKILDNMSPVNWTHDVRLGDLLKVTYNSVDYFQFKLDINEPGGNKSLLSLDGLKLILGAGGQYTQTLDNGNDLKLGGGNGLQGTLIYDMDASDYGNFVMLDATRSGGPGSGVADMVMLVPVSKFGNASADSNLILWSRFGLQAGMTADPGGSSAADAGFEEWSFMAKTGTPVNPPPPPPGVPAPGTLVLAAAALMALKLTSKKGPPNPA